MIEFNNSLVLSYRQGDNLPFVAIYVYEVSNYSVISFGQSLNATQKSQSVLLRTILCYFSCKFIFVHRNPMPAVDCFHEANWGVFASR
jgi:hypothetical protein